jgi:superfamily I DNA/RNA helicase
VPFKHEHYLKMWQLDNPKINTDFILFDEAQDANPVIAAIVANQDHAQLVYVGDSQQEIYAWTGAINALATVKVANRTFLTQSFRFGQAIADRANDVLDLLEADLRLSGNPAIASKLEVLDKPRAILTRTNAAGVSRLLAYQAAEVKAHLIGGAQDTVGFARAAQELQLTGKTYHPELVCFDSWASVQEYVKMDEGGEDLRLLVKLIDNFGAEKIIFALEHQPAEAFAEVVISTAHKSKGREWRTVQLAEDFPQQADSEKADLRLLYVAITRAKDVLDTSVLDEGTAGSGRLRDETEPNDAPVRLN